MFLITVILVGLFFSICSSSDESYLPVFLKWHRYAILIIITIFIASFGAICYVNCKNLSKEHSFMLEFNDVFLKYKFGKYLLIKLNVNYNQSLEKTIKELKQLMESEQDVIIKVNDFESFLIRECEHWKLNVSLDFYKNLAMTILLTRVIDGSLIENNGDYVFILKHNDDLLLTNLNNIIKQNEYITIYERGLKLWLTK